MFKITAEEFVLDLNGHKLIVAEFCACAGSSVTIKDSTGKGAVVADMIGIEEDAELVIKNGTFGKVTNYGGTLTIENGSFWAFDNQDGKATINGGTFTAGKRIITDPIEGTPIGEDTCYTKFNIDAETVINGGKFLADETVDYVLETYSILKADQYVYSNSIEKLVGEKYIAEYSFQNTSITGVRKYNTVEIKENPLNVIYDKILNNGVFEIKSIFKPKTHMESEFLFTAILKDKLIANGYKDCHYSAVAVTDDQDVIDPNNVYIWLSNEKVDLRRMAKVKYIEVEDKTIINEVNAVLSKMKKYNSNNDIEPENAYRLEDLYLINYLHTKSKSAIQANVGLNFTKELIEAIDGTNISFEFDARAGEGGPFFGYLFGSAIVYYGNEAQTTIKSGLTISNVLYIPTTTANTDEAYMAAALKRIGDYLGTTDGISIKVGGTYDSIYEYYGEHYNKYGLVDESTVGTNYYILTIGGEGYRFAICKKDSDKLETPKYVGSDLMTKIRITSDVTTIPLDAALTISDGDSDVVKKAMGDTIYVAYDMSLYSKAQQFEIKELKNGKFKISIPIPESLNDKEVTVYYVTSKGEKDETPPTGTIDVIKYALIVTVISVLGIVVLNKKEKNR